MAKLAIIANPNAHRNRLWPLAAQALRKAAPGAALLETPRADDLAAAAREVVKGRFDAAAIAGGDGTVQHTVTALDAASGGRILPLALLGGGAYDSLADLGRRGAPEVRLKRLHVALAAGASLPIDERDTLRVEGQVGFRLGVGLPHRFVEAIYATGRPGRLTGAWMVARAFASSLVRGAFARELYRALPARVTVDGEEWPPVPVFGMLCSTVAEAGLGLKPFRRADEQPGFFEVLGLTAGPLAFALELPPLLLGRPARRDRLIDALAERVLLDSPAGLPYFLDGEMRTSGKRLEVGLGPRLRLVRA